ncbi:hypothetical protein M5D96_006594 [Drosophila gunungcola]|uniref:Uncharacterized protein n=1 Tax=Drosophila gunungcola TaxID=103775 RepID=A0A9P9YPE7_9MUSC|nr:hypothetical protein M5D96_006594 [Drosophila gunungcola]
MVFHECDFQLVVGEVIWSVSGSHAPASGNGRFCSNQLAHGPNCHCARGAMNSPRPLGNSSSSSSSTPLHSTPLPSAQSSAF